jgi:hypothetical protein
VHYAHRKDLGLHGPKLEVPYVQLHDVLDDEQHDVDEPHVEHDEVLDVVEQGVHLPNH